MSDALAVNNTDRLEEIAVEIETIQGVALLKIGERLCEARDLFRYNRREGGFDGWIDSRLKVGRSTAYKLIDVFQAFGSESVHKVDGLSKSVLYALAAPSTPDSVREEAMRRVEAGETVSLETVANLKRELVDAKQAVKDAKRDEKVQKEIARKAGDDRQKMLRDLEWAQAQIKAQADEIERLKQDGVIHVYPSDPVPAPAPQHAQPKPAAPASESFIPTLSAIIADGCRRDLDEVIGMLRSEGLYSLAEGLEAASRRHA